MLRFIIGGTVLMFSLTVFAEDGSQLPGAQVQAPQQSQGSGQEAKARVANKLAEMRGMRGKVLTMLKEAEKNKDVIKAEALKEILQRIEATTTRAEQAVERLESQPAGADVSPGEFDRLEAEVAGSFEECSRQTAMADTVVGESYAQVPAQQSKVEVEVDKEKAPLAEPSSEITTSLEKPSEAADRVIERPAAVSPSK